MARVTVGTSNPEAFGFNERSLGCFAGSKAKEVGILVTSRGKVMREIDKLE